MHTFDAFAPPRSAPAVPQMRGRPEPPLPQGTPIYDRLLAEFRRQFRTLPGDRADEEGLSFPGFAPWTDGGDLGMPSEHGSTFRRHEYASRRAGVGRARTVHGAVAQAPLRPPHAAGGRHQFALPPGRG